MAQIKSESRSLTFATGTNSETFDYHFADYAKSYRYVRIVSLADLGFTLDAVEALSYDCKTPPAPRAFEPIGPKT